MLVTSDHNELQHDFAKGFQSVKITDSVTNEYARERGDWILSVGADARFTLLKSFLSHNPKGLYC